MHRDVWVALLKYSVSRPVCCVGPIYLHSTEWPNLMGVYRAWQYCSRWYQLTAADPPCGSTPPPTLSLQLTSGALLQSTLYTLKLFCYQLKLLVSCIPIGYSDLKTICDTNKLQFEFFYIDKQFISKWCMFFSLNLSDVRVARTRTTMTQAVNLDGLSLTKNKNKIKIRL